MPLSSITGFHLLIKLGLLSVDPSLKMLTCTESFPTFCSRIERRQSSNQRSALYTGKIIDWKKQKRHTTKSNSVKTSCKRKRKSVKRACTTGIFVACKRNLRNSEIFKKHKLRKRKSWSFENLLTMSGSTGKSTMMPDDTCWHEINFLSHQRSSRTKLRNLGSNQ